MSSCLHGLGVSHGVAVGVVLRITRGQPVASSARIDLGEVGAECARLQSACDRLRDELQLMQHRFAHQDAPGMAELVSLLGVQLSFLGESRLVRMSRDYIRKGHLSAPAAVSATLASIQDVYKQMSDPYLAARFEDIDAVGNRIIDM